MSVFYSGVGRGTFLSPIIRLFDKNAGRSKRIEAIGTRAVRCFLCAKPDDLYTAGLDAFNTKYYPESDKWVQANLRVEKLIPYTPAEGDVATGNTVITRVERVFWGNKFNIPANSVDLIVFPTGSVMPYLSEVGNDREKHAHRIVNLFNDFYDMLKPGGRFVISNLIFSVGSVERALRASKFGENNINIMLADPNDPAVKRYEEQIQNQPRNFTTLSKWLWWSYVPAKMTVATKAVVEREGEAAGAGAGAGAGLPGQGVGQGQMAANGNNDEPVASEGNTFRSEEDVKLVRWFPAGKHWRLVEVLIAFTVLMWLGYVILTWQCFAYLELPYFLPFNEQISSLFVSNANLLPFVIYLITARLRNACLEAEAEIRDQVCDRATGSVGAGYSAVMDEASISASIVMRQAHRDITPEMMAVLCRRVLTVYRGEMFDVALLVTLNSGLGWLPYFILDTILIKGANMSARMVSNVNTVSRGRLWE